MTDVTIYHNPKCSTSRDTLAAIRAAGVEPRVVEYLKTPPSAAEPAAMVKAAGIPVRQALRRKEKVYAELGLDDPDLNDAQLLAAVAAHPILLERPWVAAPAGTRLCRPKDRLLEVLPAARFA